jgi:hypothetical protein
MLETLAEAANRVQVESRIPWGSEFRREFFRIGSRSGVAGKPARIALSVRCGKVQEFRANPAQGIFCHLRKEFFRPGREFIGRDREIGLGTWSVNTRRPDNGHAS